MSGEQWMSPAQRMRSLYPGTSGAPGGTGPEQWMSPAQRVRSLYPGTTAQEAARNAPVTPVQFQGFGAGGGAMGGGPDLGGGGGAMGGGGAGWWGIRRYPAWAGAGIAGYMTSKEPKTVFDVSLAAGMATLTGGKPGLAMYGAGIGAARLQDYLFGGGTHASLKDVPTAQGPTWTAPSVAAGEGGGYAPQPGELGVVIDFANYLSQTQTPLPPRDDLRLSDLRARPSTLTDWYRTNNRYPLETAKFAREAMNVGMQGWGGGGGPPGSGLSIGCIGGAALAGAATLAVV